MAIRDDTFVANQIGLCVSRLPFAMLLSGELRGSALAFRKSSC
jgi:hypothetical protein